MSKIPLVVDYLRSGKTLSDLELEHGVVARERNNKVSLCYDQIKAKESDLLACQCRGLVLRAGTWDVLAYPFDRFFNLGQSCSATIDWSTAQVQEKLDGTLIIVYHDGEDWQCATRKDPEAATPSDEGWSYRTLVERTASTSLVEFMDGAPRSLTYMFELIGPENTNVCQYESMRMCLLGIRNTQTGQELSPTLAPTPAFRWDKPEQHDAHDFESVVAMVNARDPKHYEGVVVVDASFQRVKVKSSAYVFAHKASSALGSSWRNVIEAVATGAADDVEPLVPPMVRDRIAVARDRLSLLIDETSAVYSVIRDVEPMKEYAMLAKRHRWPAALFAMKRQGVDIGLFAAQTNPKTLAELCGLENPQSSSASSRSI